MLDDKRYDWLAPVALAADRQAVSRALTEHGSTVNSLTAVVPAMLRLVAAASRQPQRATPGFGLALDHGTSGWVASIASGSDVWTEQHDDPALALRAVMQRASADVASWSEPGD